MASKRRTHRRPAVTEEGRENQLVSMAMDLAEKQIDAGTASSQVITHFLKLGTSREKLEQERLKRENLLLDSKVEQMASQGRQEELYRDALRAMREYSGEEPAFDEEIEFDD